MRINRSGVFNKKKMVTPQEIHKAFAGAAKAVEQLGEALRRLKKAKYHKPKSKFHR